MDFYTILTLAKKMQLPLKDIDTIAEYLEHNEWGIAFEVLCSAIGGENLSVSYDEYNQIREIGEHMNMDRNLWEIFKP